MTPTITVDQLNRLGAEFWNGQRASLNAMLEDKDVSGYVFKALEVEIWRGVPPRARHSVEGLLEELNNFKRISRTSDGRLGGRPKGGDPLQRWIEAFVARDRRPDGRGARVKGA